MGSTTRTPAKKKAEAEALWSGLRELFVNAEATIKTIIETKAWEPLGYATFAEAWTARMAGVKLATQELRAEVVYRLIDEDLSDEGIREVLGSRVGDTGITALRSEKARGVPAKFASTRVRAHDRVLPCESKTLHIELLASELRSFKDIAEGRGLDIKNEAVKALRAHFYRLEHVGSSV